MTSSRPCDPSMKSMVSENRCREIVQGINDATLDYATVTLEEWLQVSFLHLYHGEEVHIELPVVYGGAAFHLHACVEQVIPGEETAALRRQM